MGAIVVLVVLAILVVDRNIKQIGTAQLRLTDGAIPALIAVETGSKLVDGLTRDIEQIPRIVTTAQSDELRARIDIELTGLEQIAQANPDVSDLAEALRRSIRTSLTEQSAALDLRDTLGNVRQAYVKSEKSKISSIEGLVLTGGVELETLLSDVDGNTGSAELAEKIARLNTLTLLSSDVQTIAFLSLAIDTATVPDEFEEITARLAFVFRNSIRKVATLPTDDAKARLVATVREMRTLLLSPGGLVDLYRERLARTARLDELRQEQAMMLRQVSELIAETLSASRGETFDSAAQIKQSTQAAQFEVRVLGAALILLIGLVALFLIERRIVRRLGRLTSSVNAIAAGKLDTPVEVDGEDELGRMAAALHVFKDNARELERSNRELASFAYAASHDLRAPLRAIQNLAEWAIEDGGDDLPEVSKGYLETLTQRVVRLSRLLGDLLDYSRVGREQHAIERIDFKEMAAELADLVNLDNAFDIRITCDVQYVTTYDAPLRQILLNLISNAVKHSDTGTGVIQIETISDESFLHISVSDDGPGIAPEYHDRVFGLFQTLKSRDDVEGSGMGLAIIKKLVEHHKCQISLTSNPEKQRGTRFDFTWPLCDTHASKRDTPWPGPRTTDRSRHEQ